MTRKDDEMTFLGVESSNENGAMTFLGVKSSNENGAILTFWCPSSSPLLSHYILQCRHRLSHVTAATGSVSSAALSPVVISTDLAAVPTLEPPTRFWSPWRELDSAWFDSDYVEQAYGQPCRMEKDWKLTYWIATVLPINSVTNSNKYQIESTRGFACFNKILTIIVIPNLTPLPFCKKKVANSDQMADRHTSVDQ